VSETPVSARTPKANALLICQRIIREADSGMVTLTGIFETVSVARLPILAQLFLYAKMTDAQGEYVFRVEVVRRNDMKAIAEAALPKVTIPDPTASSELILELGNLKFGEPGAYDLRLFANDRFVDSKSLVVRVVESRRPPREVRVVGSAVIARISDAMLDEPRPAAPV
jgi:hypothetical protein